MAQLNAAKIAGALYGLFSGLDETDRAMLEQAAGFRRQVSTDLTDGGTAGTAATERVLWINDTGMDVYVTAAYAVAPVAVTAHASNYATFNLFCKTAAGAATATIGTFATDTVTTDDMVAHAEKSLTLTAANVKVAAGSKLTCSITKAASGVAIASATAPAAIIVCLRPVV
jgi:hypothetical protein